MSKYRKAIAAGVVALGLTVAWAAGGEVSAEAVGAAWTGFLLVIGLPNATSS